MQKSQSSHVSNKEDKHQAEPQEDFTCNGCGKEFRKPVLVNMSSQGAIQTYYACPRCLTKIPEVDEKETEVSEVAVLSKEPQKTETKPEGGKCQHSFGYLKKRSKEEAIPEACLTCNKIIECMAK